MKEMTVSQIKNLFEQIAEKFGANSNVQVIQGTIEEVVAQLRAEAESVSATVSKVAGEAADTGLNAVQQLIADLNAAFAGQEEVELTHRELSVEELEAELLAILNGEGEFADDADDADDADLDDLSKDQLIDLVTELSDALEILLDRVQEQDAKLGAQDEMIALQSQLLENSNKQLTAMHEGVDQLKGLLEVVNSANSRGDEPNRTRVLSFADLLTGLAKR